MLIKIEIGDWLKNASIVGIYKVLSRLQPNLNSIKKGGNYIEFDSSLLDNFTEAYFETIIDEYRAELTYFKLVDKPIDTLNTVEDLNSFIDYAKEKLTSKSYIGAYHLAGRMELEKYFKNLKTIKITKKTTDEEMTEKINTAKSELKEMQDILSDKRLKKYILAKNVMYQIIKNFYENKSFMLSSKSSLDMFELYQADFLDKAISYEKADKSGYKYNCSCCDRPIKNLKTSFSWLCKQGVDVARKTNYFWDGITDLYMCDTCALLYSCACLGFNCKYNKGIFINNNQSIDDLIETNIVKVKDDENINNIESFAYFSVVNYIEMKKINSLNYEFDNIQVVTIDSIKKNVFEFSMLTKNILNLIYRNRRELKMISSSHIKISKTYTMYIFDEVMSCLYLNKSLYGLINELFSYYLSDSNKISIKILEAIQKIEGEKRMLKKEIEQAKTLGLKLKAELVGKKLEGKLSSLNYKLINSLRTNNSDRFLDTILDIHMYLNREVPEEILKVKFSDENFKDFGYSYLLGLNLEIKKDDENSSENNKEEN